MKHKPNTQMTTETITNPHAAGKAAQSKMSRTDQFLALWSGNTKGLVSFAKTLEMENDELRSMLKETLPLLQDHQNQCRSVRAAGLFLRVRSMLANMEAAQ